MGFTPSSACSDLAYARSRGRGVRQNRLWDAGLIRTHRLNDDPTSSSYFELKLRIVNYMSPGLAASTSIRAATLSSRPHGGGTCGRPGHPGCARPATGFTSAVVVPGRPSAGQLSLGRHDLRTDPPLELGVERHDRWVAEREGLRIQPDGDPVDRIQPWWVLRTPYHPADPCGLILGSLVPVIIRPRPHCARREDEIGAQLRVGCASGRKVEHADLIGCHRPDAGIAECPDAVERAAGSPELQERGRTKSAATRPLVPTNAPT